MLPVEPAEPVKRTEIVPRATDGIDPEQGSALDSPTCGDPKISNP